MYTHLYVSFVYTCRLCINNPLSTHLDHTCVVYMCRLCRNNSCVTLHTSILCLSCCVSSYMCGLLYVFQKKNLRVYTKTTFMYTHMCGQSFVMHTWRELWRVSSCIHTRVVRMFPRIHGECLGEYLHVPQTEEIRLPKFPRSFHESPRTYHITFSRVSPVFWRVSSCIRGWSGEAKYTYVYVHIHVNVYMYVYAYTYICMYPYVCICIYPYICTCIYMQNM